MSDAVTGQMILDFTNVIQTKGDPNIKISNAASLDAASVSDISFCTKRGDAGINTILDSTAGIVLCHSDVLAHQKMEDLVCRLLISVSNPRLEFIRCINQFFAKDAQWTISESAHIDEEANIDSRVRIEAGAIIGAGVTIAKKAVIGAGCIIDAKAYIEGKAYIQPGAVIGSEGQGFERNEKGKFLKFVQSGSVRIQKYAEVGANSNIARGTFGDTIVGRGAKIGHLVNIGHNVKIGDDVFISAGTIVGGSVRIGSGCWISPGVVIKDGITIGNNSFIGVGANIIRNVQKGQRIIGMYGMEPRTYVKMMNAAKMDSQD